MRTTLLGDRLILRWGPWGLDWHRSHPIGGRRGWTVWLHGVPLASWVSLPRAVRYAARAWWSMRARSRSRHGHR